MEFDNPIIGLEELIREAIRSQNYVAGVSGWRIAADGSAEFSTIVLRGTGVGDTIIVGPTGMPQVQIGSAPTFGYIEFPTNGPVENGVARIISARGNSGAANEYASMQINGPSVDGANDRIQTQFNSQNNDGTSNANWSVTTDNNGALLIVDKDYFSVIPPLKVAGRDQGKGLVGDGSITANVTFAATETALITTNTINFEDGRAYRVSVTGLHQYPTTDNYALYRLRKGTGTGGTIYRDQMRTGGIPITGTNSVVYQNFTLRNTSGADVSTTVTFTGVQGTAAQTWTFAASAGNVAAVIVEDIGLAADYPGNEIT